MQELRAGDWVKDKRDGMKNPITQLKENCIFLTHPEDCGDIYELWKPTEGDWCWFWDPGTKLPPILAKFTVMYREYYGSTKNASGEHSFYKCEPYLGELPSMLKDK